MRPLLTLILLFPVIELVLLILLGNVIGAGPLLLWLLISAVGGVLLMRRAGPQAWRQADWRLRRGEAFGRELTDGALVSFGGLLLILPGVLSDVIGIACLLPFSRRWLAGHYRAMPGHEPPGRPGDGPVTLEGDFHREGEPDDKKYRRLP